MLFYQPVLAAKLLHAVHVHRIGRTLRSGKRVMSFHVSVLWSSLVKGRQFRQESLPGRLCLSAGRWGAVSQSSSGLRLTNSQHREVDPAPI